MPLPPTVCAHPGCPEDAERQGRCAEHQRKAWARPSAHTQALRDPAARRAHRRARATAMKRSGGACESCGHRPRSTSELELHHPVPISRGGAMDQPGQLLLCRRCHKQRPRHA